ncbi:UNVERIFIED_CONTAM: hypothetical protein FKN15_016870 [Acipenser sinensis]
MQGEPGPPGEPGREGSIGLNGDPHYYREKTGNGKGVITGADKYALGRHTDNMQVRHR